MTDQSSGPAPGWYPDPSGAAVWRWFDGLNWTNETSDVRSRWSPRTKPWPTKLRDLPAFATAVAVGLAVWIPTMAMQPRVDYDHPARSAASPWYLPLMLIAPLVLGALLARHWQVVAIGLLAPQFLLAPWTTPRGDNDGLWTLIVFFLMILFVIAHLLAALSGTTVNRVRRRRGRPLATATSSP